MNFILSQNGLSTNGLARILGIAGPTVIGWRKRGQIPLQRVPEVADALHVSPQWLLFGTPENIPHLPTLAEFQAQLNTSTMPVDEEPSSYSTIPHISTAADALHDVLTPDATTIKQLFIDVQSVCTRTGVKPESLLCLHVNGDSMKPTLNHGDLVLVDARQRLTEEGICLVIWHQNLMLKRLQRVSSDTLLLLSDNAVSPPIEVTDSERGHLTVIGRVCAVIVTTTTYL